MFCQQETAKSGFHVNNFHCPKDCSHALEHVSNCDIHPVVKLIKDTFSGVLNRLITAAESTIVAPPQCAAASRGPPTREKSQLSVLSKHLTFSSDNRKSFSGTSRGTVWLSNCTNTVKMNVSASCHLWNSPETVYLGSVFPCFPLFFTVSQWEKHRIAINWLHKSFFFHKHWKCIPDVPAYPLPMHCIALSS